MEDGSDYRCGGLSRANGGWCKDDALKGVATNGETGLGGCKTGTARCDYGGR